MPSSRFAAPLSIVVASLMMVAVPADAQQSRNVAMLANVAPEGRTTNPNRIIYNEVWGYTAPSGKEYALLGSQTGTYVYDCSNPSNPVRRGFIAASASNWSSSIWRDFKVFGNHAYGVTEGSFGSGGAGLQIIDLTNPDQPRYVKTWSGGWQNAHNIAMDEQNGIAYVCGTGSASRDNLYVIDVKTDPVNPRLIVNARVNYIHDLVVYGGYAYCSEQNSNRLVIYDVRNLPTLTTLSRTVKPGGSIAHNTAVTEDSAVCFTTNEVGGAPVGFFDVQNPAAPRQLTTWRTGGSQTVPHNVYTRDRLVHVAYYTEGYRVLDASDPANPEPVGFYDTWSGQSIGFAGAWGAFVQQPSGTIYVSDVANGLFVLKAKAVAARYGVASAGAVPAPTIRAFGAAWLGNRNFKFVVDGAPANRAALLVVGTSRASQRLGSLRLNVALNASTAVLSLTTDGNGRASWRIPVPATPSIAGSRIRAQWFVAEASGPQGFIATRGLELELFAK